MNFPDVNLCLDEMSAEIVRTGNGEYRHLIDFLGPKCSLLLSKDSQWTDEANKEDADLNEKRNSLSLVYYYVCELADSLSHERWRST